MDIANLRLGTFRLIVKYLLDSARRENSAEARHLKTTYSWASLETDEDVFELLKQGEGGKYMKDIMSRRRINI